MTNSPRPAAKPRLQGAKKVVPGDQDIVREHIHIDRTLENPVSGFTHVFTLPNVVSVTFGDNDGQSGTQIGWGSNVAASLRQTC